MHESNTLTPTIVVTIHCDNVSITSMSQTNIYNANRWDVFNYIVNNVICDPSSENQPSGGIFSSDFDHQGAT